MTSNRVGRTFVLAATLLLLPLSVRAQGATSAADAARNRREARREARTEVQQPPEDVRTNRAMAERLRVEGALRTALARAVRERLSLTDQQATQLMDVNRRFGDDRLRLARNEVQLRRDLRRNLASGDSSRSPATARLLDELLGVQRERVELQQKEQAALSEFLTPEQRARYIAMMEQLRRRIQSRADSGRNMGGPPDE